MSAVAMRQQADSRALVLFRWKHLRGSVRIHHGNPVLLSSKDVETLLHSRKQHIFNNAAEQVCIFKPKVSTVPRSCNHVRKAQFANIEEYTKFWSEQHLYIKTCASNRHMQYSRLVLQPGSSRMRRHSAVVLCKNNCNGDLPIHVFTHSTSCDDVTVQRAHDSYNIVKARHYHPDTVYTVNDFPARDGAAMMKLCARIVDSMVVSHFQKT